MNKHLQAAMDAHSNLNIFYAIVEMLEGGTVIGDNKARDRIIKICRDEATRQLRLMDTHVAALEG